MTIHLGDCMKFMREQPGAAYDIIIADPPYETTSLGFDKSGSIPWPELSRELLRVLKPNGWFFVFGNLGVSHHFLADWKFKFEYVWVKNGFTMARWGIKRPWYIHEAINAFIKPGLKSMAGLYFDADAIAVETGGRFMRTPARRRKNTEFRASHNMPQDNPVRTDTIVRHPSSVLYANRKTNLPVAERTDHPTQKPVSIYEILLRGYCPPDGLAFDPFGGSGTLAIAAMNTGREYHLSELNPEYHAAIKERVARHVPRMETARRQQSITAHMDGEGAA